MRNAARSTVTLAVLAALAVLAGATAGCGTNAAIKEARVLLDGGDAGRAYARLEAEARKNPGDGETLRYLARAAVRIGRDAEAAGALDRAESLGRSDSLKVRKERDELWRGLFLPVRGVLDTLDRADVAAVATALDAVARGEIIDPRRAANPAARAALLRASLSGARIDSLLAVAEELAGTDRESLPFVVGVMLEIARRQAVEDPEAAVRTGRRATRLAPGDVQAEYDLGVHVHQLAEATSDTSAYRESGEHFQRVLEKIPDDVDARYNLALARYRLNDVEGTRREVFHLLNRAPLEARAHLLAARLRLAAGDTMRARGHIVAMRALGGAAVDVPTSAFLVSADAGREGRKRFVLVGPPDRIFRYEERSGDRIEVWFYLTRPRVVAFSGGDVIAELDLSGGIDDQGFVGVAGAAP